VVLLPCRHCARCVGERARGKIEWLCIQERWNPEVVIILGTAACYRRATVGSSHDDCIRIIQRCIRGRSVPTLALWRASCSYRPATVLARKCSKCCQLFRAFRGLAFLRGMVQPYFSVGSLGYPSGLLKGRKHVSVLTQWAGSSGISWCIRSLVKKTLHCRRAGFEPQRTSSFRKRVRAHQVLGEAVRARTTIPHFVLTL